MDQNQLKELQNTLKQLKHLKILNLADNKLEKLPQFLIKMKTMGLVVSIKTSKLLTLELNFPNQISIIYLRFTVSLLLL